MYVTMTVPSKRLLIQSRCAQVELERLDALHSMIHERALNNRLVNAELDWQAQRRLHILDVGYGTGIWANDLARLNTNVSVVGIDLCSNSPARSDDTPNATFVAPLDFTQPDWGFQPASFDLIRMSQLSGCVPDWLQLYSTALR